ncbi:MAG: hypothetical protein ACM3JD_14545, partial [Rudaea sp.]
MTELIPRGSGLMEGTKPVRGQAADDRRADGELTDRLISHRANLWIAWGLWSFSLLLSVSIFFATNSSRIRQMQDLAVLHRAGLEAFGLSRDFLPPFMLAADTVTFGAYLLVGLLIFARKSRETLALFA